MLYVVDRPMMPSICISPRAHGDAALKEHACGKDDDAYFFFFAVTTAAAEAEASATQKAGQCSATYAGGGASSRPRLGQKL